jgi:hypothetical protein
MKQIARQHGRSRRMQELPPGGPTTVRRGQYPQPHQDPPHRGRADPVPEAEQFALVLAPQHRDLLVQHQQLGIFSTPTNALAARSIQQADEHQIQHPYHHKPAILPAQRLSRLAYSQAS